MCVGVRDFELVRRVVSVDVHPPQRDGGHLLRLGRHLCQFPRERLQRRQKLGRMQQPKGTRVEREKDGGLPNCRSDEHHSNQQRSSIAPAHDSVDCENLRTSGHSAPRQTVDLLTTVAGLFTCFYTCRYSPQRTPHSTHTHLRLQPHAHHKNKYLTNTTTTTRTLDNQPTTP